MKKLLLTALLILSSLSVADDTELYVGHSAQAGKKPKVLIIFDNSGSMNTLENVKDSYVNDPENPYPAVGGYNSLNEDFIYYTKGSGDGAKLVPDSPSEQRRFLSIINSCETARLVLDEVGFYTGYIREYSIKGNSGSWIEIPGNNGGNIEVIDCLDDIELNRPENPGVDKDGVQLPTGYPIDGAGTKQNPIYYTEDTVNSNTNFGVGEVVTLYTDNYLRWSQSEKDDIGSEDKSRLAIAKETVINLINTNFSADFGLQIFNYNFDGENVRDGGRVVFGIQEMDTAKRVEFASLIPNSVNWPANTPLCETLYEASRYFGGLSVEFGDDDSKYQNSYAGNVPPRDTNIEDGDNYKSPYSGCAEDIYVILITDGEPTYDHAADTDIADLTGIGAKFGDDNNYLPALAGWMNTHDLNSSLDGEQRAKLYTIGFSSGATAATSLLEKAAELGGGQYYSAIEPAELLASLQSALTDILDVNGTFTSPSVAANNFDRTETLDAVYYTMFLPDRGSRWQGNLKKLKITSTGIVDRENVSAIGSNGNIEPDAKTFWYTGDADGDEVSEGGVADMLRNKSSRVLYSDIGTGGALVPLQYSTAASKLGSAQDLADFMKVDILDAPSYFSWSMGIDVDDEDDDGSTTDMRYDVFGDPLHSKPLVINYGGTLASQDVRIIVGTNAGALHMFDDNGSTVSETWAIMPKEFFPNIASLRDNYPSSAKSYGIDGSATLYISDDNGNGKVDGDDKVWVFFGLRRGGSSYYAIDVTDPDTPKLMWHIDNNTTGFSELGQTWSQPKIGFSAINIDSGTPIPVIFFGAGYATSKDTAGIGADDTIGRGIYMVDAETGTLKWSLTPSAQSATNTQFTGTDSIPSRIAILDSDSDGLVDRLYTGDTGGNVWRVDMPGATPNSGTTPWSVIKLASLGGNTNLTDRRFFSQPVIARASITQTVKTETVDTNGNSTFTLDQYEKPFDAVLIGSGDRTNPLGTDTDDKFFMIKDEFITTQSLTGSDVPTVITIAGTVVDGKDYGLKDYTSNPLEGISDKLKNNTPLTTVEEADLLDATIKSGWYIDFEGSGEKSMGSGDVVAGVAYFTSFTPSLTQNKNNCAPVGAGALYAVHLSLGTTIYDKRKIIVSEANPPGEITFVTIIDSNADHSDPNNSPPKNFAAIAPDILVLRDADKNVGIKVETSRIYLYVTE